ncbi:MAG: DUF2207 domain-containing protein, partial [Prevotella sp.]|nr:DUF2207 domain-containing protein [Prevotella sp.]
MREEETSRTDVMGMLEREGRKRKISKKDLKELYGMKKFLLEFTLIGDKGIRELPLWREYMVYAQLFGIADKVSKNFREAYPDFLQVNDLAWRVARVPDVFSYGK